MFKSRIQEQVNLIAIPPACRHITHCAVRFQFTENPLLTTTAVVQGDSPGRTEWFVGQYHFEGKSILMRYEQTQLQGPFVLDLRLLAHKDKSVAMAPGLRFPVRFKVVAGGIERIPEAAQSGFSMV